MRKLRKSGVIAAVIALSTAVSMLLSGCLTSTLLLNKFGHEVREILSGETEDPWESHETQETSALPDYDPEGTCYEDGLSFPDFTDAVFAKMLEGNTLNIHFYLADPSAYGLDQGEVSWGDPVFTDAAAAEYEDWLNDTLAYLSNFKKYELTREEQLVYDMLQSYVNTELSSCGLELYYEPLGPNSGFQAQLPIYLAQYAFGTEQDVINYLSLLEQLPDYFAGLVEYEQQKADAGLFMEDALLDNVIDQCQQFLNGHEDSFLYANFDSKLDKLGLPDEDAAKYKEQNARLVEEGVYEAYVILINGLNELRGSNVYAGGFCNYPEGDAFYAYLVRSSVGTSMSPKELCTLLDQEMNKGVLHLQKIYQRNADAYSEWESLEFPTKDPNLLMRMLMESTKADYPALSDVDYSIDYVDASLREYLSPACYFIPPVDTTTINSILINCDRGAEPDDIFTTMAHEGYPGHLYQTNFLKEHSDLVLHQLLSTSGFAEGWAEYVELNSYNLIDGFSAEAADFAKTNDFITLCLYARADLGVHAEGWTVDDVNSLVEEYFGPGNEEASEWIYEYVLGDPGGYLDYVIGAIEIENIRARAEKKDGYTLKGFHEELLTLSGAPFDIIRKYMFE